MRPACAATSPCDKLRRAAFIPARMSRAIISGESLAGPMVATIGAPRLSGPRVTAVYSAT
jgi:hypothetical protein